MSLILVEHHTDEPALYGAFAAAVVRRTEARFSHLPARFDTGRFPDAVQHVTADGALVGSGLVAVERLTAEPLTAEASPDALIARAVSDDVVVPLHPPLQGALGAELRARIAARKVPLRDLLVVGEAGRFCFLDRAAGAVDPILGSWSRDAYGRLTSEGEPTSAGERRLRVGLVGTERDHRSVYPAVMAALGDAADAVGVVADVTFIDLLGLASARLPEIFQAVDGLVLPGGADMINVPGQIEMAHGALRSGTPTLGLCLGMQSMVTASAQQALGSRAVGMAEADPTAPIKSFTPMAANPALQPHRLGDQPIRVEASSRLARWLGPTAVVRCNHRFHFNMALLDQITGAGLQVSACDETGQIVDAVEHATHPFYVGFQGHPELSSRPGCPHPVVKMFVEGLV